MSQKPVSRPKKGLSAEDDVGEAPHPILSTHYSALITFFLGRNSMKHDMQRPLALPMPVPLVLGLVMLLRPDWLM